MENLAFIYMPNIKIHVDDPKKPTGGICFGFRRP
jgi:hypothetical protein